MAGCFAIGELAADTGVKVPTIRYYESIGLMPSADRTASGRRVYDGAALARLRFIRHARDLGFEVDAIRTLLRLREQPDRSCAEADAAARHHLANVTEKIVRLKALKGELEAMIKACRHQTVNECTVIEVIGDHELCRTSQH